MNLKIHTKMMLKLIVGDEHSIRGISTADGIFSDFLFWIFSLLHIFMMNKGDYEG